MLRPLTRVELRQEDKAEARQTHCVPLAPCSLCSRRLLLRPLRACTRRTRDASRCARRRQQWSEPSHVVTSQQLVEVLKAAEGKQNVALPKMEARLARTLSRVARPHARIDAHRLQNPLP